MVGKTAKAPNRETVTTINDDGSRYVLHPADVSGRFTVRRRVFGTVLLAVYILLPWIPVNGNPAVFFDLGARQFHLFGLTFVPQDLWLGFFVITGLGFALFYVTALFGRLWCGWACPYTVFLEHIYRRIERFTDGDGTARRRLDAAPWSARKVRLRVLKHGLFFLCSALIAHIFLAYFISLEKLYGYMRASPAEHLTAFGVVLFLTGALHFSFGWFREQFCIILCPYGRIQSALTDEQTMVIGYDEKRGEPRGKAGDPANGDCIGCNRCVQVCPTGIDIRNGLQIECIGCAACIDACDAVMDKLGRERGLVRYDSEVGLAGKKREVVRPRIVIYSVLLLVGVAAMTFSLTRVKPFFIGVTRMRGEPYYATDAGVRNQYQLRVANKRNRTVSYAVDVRGLPEGAVVTGFEVPLELEAHAEQLRPFTVTLPYGSYQRGDEFEVAVAGGVSGSELVKKVPFVGPAAGGKKL